MASASVPLMALWASADVPLGVRRPWQVFEDKQWASMSAAGVASFAVGQRSTSRADLARESFSKLPHQRQLDFAEASLRELAAYVRWRKGRLQQPQESGLGEAGGAPEPLLRRKRPVELQLQTQWSQLDADTKAEWLPAEDEDPRRALAEDGRWAPLLAATAPPEPAPRAREAALEDSYEEAAASDNGEASRSCSDWDGSSTDSPQPTRRSSAPGRRLTRAATRAAAATPSPLEGRKRGRPRHHESLPVTPPKKAKRAADSSIRRRGGGGAAAGSASGRAAPACRACGGALAAVRSALIPKARAREPQYCAPCGEVFARERRLSCRPGDVVWARLSARAPLWPALVISLDFQTPSEPRPYWVQPVAGDPAGETLGKGGAWLGDASVLPWDAGPHPSELPEGTRRRSAATLADAALRSAPKALTPAPPAAAAAAPRGAAPATRAASAASTVRSGSARRGAVQAAAPPPAAPAADVGAAVSAPPPPRDELESVLQVMRALIGEVQQLRERLRAMESTQGLALRQ